MKFKGSTALFIGVFAFAIAIGTGIQPPELGVSDDKAQPTSAEDVSNYEGIVAWQHMRDVDSDGDREVINQGESHNLIVDQGLNVAECYFSDVSCPTGFDPANDDISYIAVGNNVGTLSASDVGLTSEITSGGLNRQNGNVIDLGVGNYSVSATFTASSDFNGVNATGLMWNQTDGSDSLVAANKFQGVDMLADDQLTVNWTEVSFTNAP